MEGQTNIDSNRSDILSHKLMIIGTSAIFTASIAAVIFDKKYDLIREYLSPSVVDENIKEMKKAMKACMDEADGHLTEFRLSDCVEDKVLENTGNFREISCKIDEAGEGNCKLATIF